jgi:hypothetical protein
MVLRNSDSRRARNIGFSLRVAIGPFLVLTATAMHPAAVCAMPVHVVETRGMRVGDLGSVPPQHEAQLQQATGAPQVPRVGYYYHYSGLFYLDFWTSEGGYCLYHGDRFWIVEPEAAAALLGIPVSQLSKPWRYRFPVGLLLAATVIGAVIYIDVANRSSNWRREKRFASLVGDPRYQRAIRQLDESAPEELEADAYASDREVPRVQNSPGQHNVLQLRFKHAVDGLAEDGIDRQEASQNLKFLIEELSYRQRMKVLLGDGN